MNTNDAFNPCPETTEAILAEMGARQLNFIQLAARYNTTVLRFTRWLNSPEISALFLEIQTAIATYIRQGAVLSAPVVPAVMHALSTSLDLSAIRDPANLPAREHARKLVTQILRLSKFTAFGEPRLRAPRARNPSPAPAAEPATASTPTTPSTPAASTTQLPQAHSQPRSGHTVASAHHVGSPPANPPAPRHSPEPPHQHPQSDSPPPRPAASVHASLHANLHASSHAKLPAPSALPASTAPS